MAKRYLVEVVIGAKDKLSSVLESARRGALERFGHKITDLVQQLPQMAVEMIKLGAAVERQRGAVDNLAASFGTSGAAIVGAIQNASSFTIDRMTAMGAASKAMMLDVAKSPEEFERLTKVAVRLGQAMGLNAARSIDDFVTAAGRQSIMIADNLGLTIKAGEAYDKYALKLGKTAEALTAAEKKQAFLGAMLDAGEIKTAAMGKATESLAMDIERLEAKFADAKVALGLWMAEVAVAIVRMNELAPLTEELHKQIIGASDSYAEYRRQMAETDVYLEKMNRGTETFSDLLPGAIEAIEEESGALTELEFATRKQNEITQDTIRVMEEMRAGTWRQIQALEEAKTATWEMTMPLEELLQISPTLAQAMNMVGEAAERERDEMTRLARETEAAALAQVNLAEKMTDVTATEVAKIAIGELREARDADKISIDEYVAAVTRIQLAYGLVTEEGIRLADGLSRITEEFAEGTLGEYAFDASLQAIIADLPPTTAELEEMARAEDEAAREAKRLAEEVFNAAAATGDQFVAMVGDATAETDIFALALFESADAAGADADMLASLAGTLGIYTNAEIEAALAAMTLESAIVALGGAIVAGETTMEEAIASMRDLIDTLPVGAAAYEHTARATHHGSQVDREAAKAKREMEKAMRDAARAAEAEARELERLAALTGDYLVKALGDAEEGTDEWSLALFEAADAIGMEAEQLALLAGALDLYTEEQVEAALAAAAFEVRINELAALMAEGMGIDEAVKKFNEFREALGLFEVGPALDVAGIAAEIAALTAQYNTLLAGGATPGTLAALMAQITALQAMITPAQFGFSGMVGPGFGGARVFLAGEGGPEFVQVVPTGGGRSTHNEFNMTVNTRATAPSVRRDFETMRALVG